MDGHSLYPDRPEHMPELAERAFRRGPILLRLLLSALLDAQQHRAIHDQITRLKQEVHEAQYCLPPRTGACPQQPRPAVVRFVEDELQSSPVNPHLHQPGPHLGRRRGNRVHTQVQDQNFWSGVCFIPGEMTYDQTHFETG